MTTTHTIQVKTLVWEPHKVNSKHMRATTPLGDYIAWHDGDLWVTGPTIGDFHYGDQKTAMAEAQKHYQAIVESCIDGGEG